LFNIFTKNNFYLNKLETVTFKGISGYQGYTKTIFNKFNTNYKYNLEKYFLQLRRKISRLSC